MTDVIQALCHLRRPGLLIRAAQLGMQSYERARDLGRIIHGERLPAPDRAVKRLMDLEAELEMSRQERDATYSASRHVETLIALMAEARALLTRGPVSV